MHVKSLLVSKFLHNLEITGTPVIVEITGIPVIHTLANIWKKSSNIIKIF